MNFAQWVITAVVIICAIVFLFVWHYRTWSVRKSESTQ